MISSDAAADGTEHVLYGDERDPEVVWRIGYKSEHTCPCCVAELEIIHVLVPHFTAEFVR